MGSSTFSIIIRAKNEAARALSAAAKQISQIEGAVARTSKQAERATTGLRGMSNQLERIGSQLPMLAGSGGLAYGLKKTADVAFQANAQMMVFERTVLAFGQSLEESRRILDEVAAKLQVAPEQIAASASLMLRAGYDMEQVAAAFEAGAASALAAGKSVQSGVENVSLALSTGLSIYLNYIGIAENIGPVIRRVINSHKDASAEVVKAAQNQAALNVVLKATAQEVKALPTLLGGYQGALNRLNVAVFNLTKAIGEEVLPLLTVMIVKLEEAVQWFTRLPDTVKAFTVGVSGASVAVVALGAALAALKQIIGILGGPAGWIMLLVTALGGVATVLYNRTIPAVSEGKKALDRLAAAAAETKRQVHEMNMAQLRAARTEALNAWMRGIRELRREFADAGPAVQRFLDDLTQAGMEGRPLEGLEQTVQRIELLVRGLQASGRDIEASGVLDFSRNLIGLRDYAAQLEDVTKQLEAYLQASKDMLNNKPPPSEEDNERLREYLELWEEINNLPIFKGSAFAAAQKAMGTTPDAMLRATAHEAQRVVEVMSTMSPDTFERLQERVEGLNDELSGTWRIIHTTFSTGALVTAPDTLDRINDHAERVKDTISRQKEEAQRLNEKLRKQLELWRQIQNLDILKASYWIELARAMGSAPDAMARNAEHVVKKTVAVMSTMSPDTFERLQNRLEGVADAAKEAAEQIYPIFASPAAQATSPDTLARIEEHTKKAADNASKLKQKNKEAAEAAERIAEAYQHARDALNALTDGVSSFISSAQLAASGDAKGAFDAFMDGLASLASMIPEIGGLIASVISLVKTLVVSLWDAITDPTGAKRAERTLSDVADKYRLIGKEAFEAAKQTTKAQKGFWIFKREITKVSINEELLQAAEAIARTLESGVDSALRSGIKAFLEGKADWKTQLRDGIRDAIYNGIIEAVIQAGIIQGMLAEEFTALNKALAEQNWEEAQKITADIMNRIPEVEQKVEQIFSQFKMPEYSDGVVTDDNALVYQLPEVPVVTAPTWVEQMGAAVAKFDRAVDRLLDGVNASRFGLRGVI